jgi:hypothetical protein
MYLAWMQNLVKKLVFIIIDISMHSLAVLFLNLEPSYLVNITNCSCIRKLLLVIKVATAVSLAGEPALLFVLPANAYTYIDLPKSVASLVMSISSLQSPGGGVGYWIDIATLIIKSNRGMGFNFWISHHYHYTCIIVTCPRTWRHDRKSTSPNFNGTSDTLRDPPLRPRFKNSLSGGPGPKSPADYTFFYWLVIFQGGMYLLACICGLFAKSPGPADIHQDSENVENSAILQPATEDHSLFIGSIRIQIPPAQNVQPNISTPDMI